ncbi:MAG: acyl-ACP thioesterase domain-containing protein [Mycobacteriaceae bacterium]
MNAPAVPNEWLAPLPQQGRVFTSFWPVRVGDVDTEGRLRLDGIGRYLQDLGNDDLDDGGARGSHPVWIVRRTVIDVLVPPGWPDELTLRRWCSGLSSSWCAERVQLASTSGGLIETEGFWINYSPQTQRPARLGPEFAASIGGSTDNHRLRWRRWLHDESPAGPITPFPLRSSDFDPSRHVNNAVYLAAVEDQLATRPELLARPYRATIEYLKPIVPGAQLSLRTRHDHRGFLVWFLVDGETYAIAALLRRPPAQS